LVWTSLLARCAEIEVGARVRLLNEDDGDRELRVAWIRADRELFVLVDHRGLKAHELQLVELALGLHKQRIEIEQPDGRPLSDRAVDSILVRMEERLAHQAKHDSLTGLINRQQFHAAVQKALDMPARPGDSGVLLWLDIDQFRLVNDIRGYETGDRLLAAIAKLLEGVRGAKVLGHMGGDRFALMLPDIGLADANQRAQEICGLVREMPFDWLGQAVALSSSIGVVGMGIGHEGLGDLLQAADDALAMAKAAGGDRVYVYDEEDPEITRRKESVHWVVQVDEALDRGHLRLRCQPIVPVRAGSGLQPHYEVLLGVHSATSEPLPIAEFIDAAERYNRMRAVDRWIARTAMEWIAANRDQMPLLHGFAVNLSGQTASDPSFIDFVREQFEHTGIDPAWLSFEVTETAAVSDLSSSAGIIQDLKSLGCKIALDDFGSGLASYSYLKELPVDWLKIDGVFVRKIAENREDLAVVKSINEIGHFLGKQTIAEYVGDDKILRLIRAIGVDYAQGFGISPPLFMDELVQTIEAATG
jgi:diguanylate cyclase (GGDEF)-like protein